MQIEGSTDCLPGKEHEKSGAHQNTNSDLAIPTLETLARKI